MSIAPVQQLAQVPPSNLQPSPGNIVANQATSIANARVLSVDLALVAVPLDSGALEFQSPARSTGEYFLSNQGLLPPTPAALLTVSRLPSLSQGINRPVFGGGGMEASLTANPNAANTVGVDPSHQNITPAGEEPPPKPAQSAIAPQLPAVPPPGLLPPPQLDGGAPQSGVPPDKSWAQASASFFAAEVDGESLQEEPATLRAPDLVQTAAALAGAMAAMTWHHEPAGQRRWRGEDGDLIVSNGDAVSPDSAQPSELVEFTPQGRFVAEFSVDASAGGAFGIAATDDNGQLRFAAVDDNTNTVSVWHFDTGS
jgi:hypothetical protein